MSLINTLRFITSHPLNRDRKFQAVKDFIMWQMGSRFVPGPIAVPFVNNSLLIVSRGMTGATGNVYCGLHEFEDMAFLLHFLRPCDLFVDIGANIGSYTILASAVAGAESIAVEPIPATFGHLMKNININGVNPLVRAMNIGLAAAPGQLKFTSSLDTVNHVATENEKSTAEAMTVLAETLDNVLEEKIPQMIKIDVEGFETSVIDGAGRTLSDNRVCCVVMELNGSGERYGFNEEALHKKMIDYGFKTFAYSPFDRKLISLHERKSTSGNTLYIRDCDLAQKRISAAPVFYVHGKGI